MKVSTPKNYTLVLARSLADREVCPGRDAIIIEECYRDFSTPTQIASGPPTVRVWPFAATTAFVATDQDDHQISPVKKILLFS